MQPGCYPRVNGAMIQSGSLNEQIVSLVGRFVSNSNSNSDYYSFQCVDYEIVPVHLADGCNLDPTMIELASPVNDNNSASSTMAMELVGMQQLHPGTNDSVFEVRNNNLYACRCILV